LKGKIVYYGEISQNEVILSGSLFFSNIYCERRSTMKEVNLLKKWLDFKHMNQKELAEKMGVTPSFISYYINKDDISYRKTTVKKFAEIFEVDPDTFLKGPRIYIEGMDIGSTNQEQVLSDENQIRIRLINFIMKLNDSELRHLHNLLNSYSEL
jgi:transcriptional regulator with XRE-family HTH domain